MGWTSGVQILAEAMMGFTFFASAFSPVLGPTQPLIQRVLLALIQEVK